MDRLRIALVGQPNVGKSMLINAISNAQLKVGNFTGVTVEKAQVLFEFKGRAIEIVDLPGSYTLSDYSLDERVTREFLDTESYDLILNVVDSTNLERNLYLTAELLEFEKPMVIALNMSDEAKKEGIIIDATQLSAILGVPCVQVSAVTKEGLEELFDVVLRQAKEPAPPSKMVYPDALELEIQKLTTFLERKVHKLSSLSLSARMVAIRLLKQDDRTYRALHDSGLWVQLGPMLTEAITRLTEAFDTNDIEEIFLRARHSFARGAAQEVTSRTKQIGQSFGERVDALLIHKIWGIPIFLFFMWLLFQATFTLGEFPMAWIEALFGWLGEQARALIDDPKIESLVADGILGGVGAVVLFLPNIVILFLGIAILETTGYMARIAFLLDGLFHRFGLHGKSFIPLVTGFGCSVPAYMATRTLKNEKDRLVTLFIIGFMSCGAKLPVYVLFIGAFFPGEGAGNILFAIYLAGALFGLIAAKILRLFVFKGEDEPFVMEMPKYRLPTFRLIWFTVYGKAKSYLEKAGTFILAASLLIWLASNYPVHDDLQQSYQARIEAAANDDEKMALANELAQKELEGSFLGMIGKATEPLVAPLGFDWRMAVALETGLAAKEVVVATMGVLYSLGEVDEGSDALKVRLKEAIPLPSALAFIVFVMLYMPCLAATTVFSKEAGSWRYTAWLFLFTMSSAWIAAFITYHIASIVVG
ncbi:MAG: ferrous iron transport protein B [Campylobacterales bacterium]